MPDPRDLFDRLDAGPRVLYDCLLLVLLPGCGESTRGEIRSLVSLLLPPSPRNPASLDVDKVDILEKTSNILEWTHLFSFNFIKYRFFSFRLYVK